MAKVIPLRKKKQNSRAWDLVRKLKPTLDDAVMFAGIIITVVLPTITYCSNRGPVAPLILAAVGVLGIGIGIAVHFCCPFEVLSCVDRGKSTAQRTSEKDWKNAA